MIIDADGAGRGALSRVFDVCVVGTGPAGMTLARRLAQAGFDVALMEAGGREVTPETQAPYVGENAGLDYYPLETTRDRVLGGTSLSWGGNCRALDARDFEPNAENPMSGWPIAKSDLDPYAAEADEILDLASETGPEPGAPEMEGFTPIVYRESAPVTRFAEKYGSELEASERITLVLNANLVDLRLGEDLGAVTGAVFRSYDAQDPGFTIAARHYALCLGGIETPRLLLNCTSQIPEGIGNENDLVGRYFQEHPHVLVGDVVFEEASSDKHVFAPAPGFLEENGILNFVLFLVSQETPALSLPREALRSVKCVAPFTERLTDAVMGSGPPCGDGGMGAWWRRRGAGPGETGRVRLECEQALNPESRVRLSEDRDALGLRRAVLDWRLTDLDTATIRTAAVAFGTELAARGIGRMQLRDWLLGDDVTLPGPGDREGSIGGRHHMGTTRMGTDPTTSIVDATCRVHGIDNLYLGSSSVFASSGAATPTYTIVQLALRLGDHLRDRLRA